MGGNVSKKAKKRPETTTTATASLATASSAVTVVATKKASKGSLRRRRSSTYKNAKAKKGRTLTQSKSSSPDDSGQGSLKASQAESDSDNLTCPFCDDLVHHQRPSAGDSDTDDQLLYCSKGSLCSRRSRATVKSRKVPGKPKRKKKKTAISLRADIIDDKNTDNIRRDLTTTLQGQKGCCKDLIIKLKNL